MQHTQQLDAGALDAIDDDERGAADDKLAGALFAPCAAYLWVLAKLADLVGNAVALLDGGPGVGLGDVVQLSVTVSYRPA